MGAMKRLESFDAVYILETSLAQEIQASLGWRVDDSATRKGSSLLSKYLLGNLTDIDSELLKSQNRFDDLLFKAGQQLAALDALIFRHPAFSNEVAKVKCRCGALCPD